MLTLPSRAPFADPQLPAVEVLLSGQATGLLGAALDAAGADIGQVRTAQVRYRPHTVITVSYRAEVSMPGESRHTATFVAHAGSGLPEGSVVVSDGEVQVGVWRFPNDPMLPGLRHAVDAQLLPRLLRRVGIDEGPRRLRTRSYRPTRRAVVEVTTDTRRVFLKVVKPSRAVALADRHDRLAGHLAVPCHLGGDLALGVLALAPLSGRPLRDLLTEDEPVGLPQPEELVALLDALPAGGRRVTGVAGRVVEHGDLLAAVLPAWADRLAQLTEVVTGAAEPEPAPVPVHGDFHAGQVMVDEGRAHGLLDVDAAGVGSRADDLATMLAYLEALAVDGPERSALTAFATAAAGTFSAKAPDRELRRRTAAALIGFATVPFIAQRPEWAEGVARRLERAEALAADPG